jgi:cell division protein FtsB
MAHTSVSTAPGWPGDIGSSAPRHSPCAKRRWIFGAVFLLVILGLATVANYGPLQAYYDARARLEQAGAAVEALATEKAALQSELGKLTEAGYLESLAREELTYARPGEDVYIITGAADEGAQPEDTPSVSADERGPLERFLSALGGLF